MDDGLSGAPPPPGDLCSEVGDLQLNGVPFEDVGRTFLVIVGGRGGQPLVIKVCYIYGSLFINAS